MALRPIMPLPFENEPGRDLGERPSLEWVAPTSLWVDETYQRGSSRRSMELVRKIIANFAWNRMKPPIAVRNEDKLHVIDGQHTAIAAATLGIAEIPVFIVGATDLADRARSFVGHNADRIPVTSFDIYRALVAAGDEQAMEVDAVMKRANVRLRLINQTTICAEGDTAAIATIRTLVKARGPMQARRVLQALVDGKCAPLVASQIKAVDQMLCVEDRTTDMAALARIIRAEGPEGLLQAETRAKVIKEPVWKVLSARWRKHLNAARTAA